MRYLIILSLVFAACHAKPQTETTTIAKDSVESMVPKADTTAPKFTAAMVDNKKDPNCGMPVTAGIMDTVHYKGKVYGFCSDECRDAFLKNPVAMVKAAELK
jgi:YHS domain-containing protein